MASPTSSQRLSFTQLVLDMGLADKKGLLKARKLIKKRKADGKKLTVARACVELEILTERQAKKVQLELKRLKTGFASSDEFRPAEDDDEAAKKAKRKAKRRKAKKEAKAEARKKAEKDADDEVADDEDEPKAKKKETKGKKAKKDADADADDEVADDEVADDEDEPKAKKKETKVVKMTVFEVADDEDEPKAKKAKKALAKKGPPLDELEIESDSEPESEEEAPPKKQKTKLGKEIVLDSQRAERQKKKKKKPIARRRRGVGDTSEAPPEPRKGANVPLLALGSGVVVLLLIMGGVVMTSGKGGDGGGEVADADIVEPLSGDTSDDTSGTPDTSAPNVDPPKSSGSAKSRRIQAEDLAEKYALEADDLAAEGKFSEAIERLEKYPQDLRDQSAWREVGEVDLKKYRKLLPLQEEFETALTSVEGGSHDQLRELFSKLAEDEDLSEESFVAAFDRRAKEAMGEEKYDALQADLEEEAVADAADDVDAFETDEEEEIEFEAPKELEVETRGNEGRRKRFREAIATAQQNLTQAKRTLNQRVAARKKKIKAEAKKVLKAAKKIKLEAEGLGKVTVTAYNEAGFTVKTGKGKKTFGWGNCPAKLGHKLKKLAIDGKDADGIFELGMYALRRAEFDLALRDFQQAVKLKPSLQSSVPNLKSMKDLVKLFRGKKSLNSGGGESQVNWSFDGGRPQETMDFTAIDKRQKVEVIGGQLQIQAPTGFFVVAANVRGAWEQKAKLEVVLASNAPPPGVMVKSKAGLYVVQFGQKTELYKGWGPQAKVEASSDVRATQGSKVLVEVKTKGNEQGTIKVTVGDREAFVADVPLDGEIEFMLGARGNGTVRFDNVSIVGILSQKWVRRTKASAPNEIGRALAELERAKKASSSGGSKIPVAYMKTSAEDEVGMEGATEAQKTLIAGGRTMIEQGNMWGGLKQFEKAAEDYRFHVGNYLYALALVRSDPQGAVIRLRRCVKGVEDFYEAKVALANALFRLGRYEDGEKLLDEVAAIRPDFAPAYSARSTVLTVRGQYSDSLNILELAEVLGPGDPTTTAMKGRVVALAEGPAWADRKRGVTEHYNLDTDMVDYADIFASRLESIRKRYEEAYPTLINPDAPERKASVLIFGQPEGYYQYSERTSGDRAENTLGHFSPTTGQLLLFLEDDPDDWNSFHVIFHEGMHQWCHSNGLGLPFWANEGMAEYVGGTRLSDDGEEIVQRGAIDTFLKQRLRNLTSNWKQHISWQDIMSQSPQEFYAGNSPLKYAQAWTMIHFIMEGKEEEAKSKERPKPFSATKLRDTFTAYLKHFKDVSLEQKDSARGGAKLEYIYVDTFHQLEMEDVTKRWEKWVEGLAKRAGMGWTLPADDEGDE